VCGCVCVIVCVWWVCCVCVWCGVCVFVVRVCVCVCVTLNIQHAKCTVACLALHYFPHYYKNRNSSLQIYKQISIFLFSLKFLFETLLNTRRYQRAIKIVYSSLCKVPAFLSDFNNNNLSRQFSKNFEIHNFQ